MHKKLLKLPKNVLNEINKDERHLLKLVREFFKRNISVAVIGSITLLVFLTIIVVGQTKDHYRPKLIPVNETSESMQSDQSANQNNTASNNTVSETALEPAKETPETTASIDKTYGILEVTYTKDGFTPKNSQAHKNQIIRMINKTDKNINLEQLIKSYTELGEIIKIEPTGKLEFRLYKPKLWSFQEKDTKDFGSVFVY